MKYQFDVLDKKDVYRGFFKVARYLVEYDYFQGGRSGVQMRECLGYGSVVAALPFDPIRREFVFIEQFRIGAMVAGDTPWQHEIVAGFIDNPEESAIVAVHRELQEEIGTQAKQLHFVQEYYNSPGSNAGRTQLYFAEVDANDVKTYTGIHEEGEDIRVFCVPYHEAYRRLIAGEINNATTLIALQAFWLHQNHVPDLN